jgi:hypothetical protein
MDNGAQRGDSCPLFAIQNNVGCKITRSKEADV